MTISKIINIKKNWPYICLLLIVAVGHYLRFYNIENTFAFGWDQGRDAWEVRDILDGKHSLKGPRVGVGDFYLGPAYFYLLAPFYFLTNGDPMAANYFNMIVNIFNITTIYFVVSRLFSIRSGLLAAFLFSVSAYAIGKTMVPWNVSPIPGVSILIFYSLHQLTQNKLKWIYPLSSLTGLFFHLHFTAVFLPVIYLPVLFFISRKTTFLKHLAFSAPLFLIWIIPSLAAEIGTSHENYFRFKHFIRDYFIGFHLRFMLYRLPDSLIQIQALLDPFFGLAKFAVLPIFVASTFLEKDRKLRTLGLLVPMWFIVPLLGFTLYGGPISDYYFFLNFSIAILIVAYFIDRFLRWHGWFRHPTVVLLVILFAYSNTKDLWIKPYTGGLEAQKKQAETAFASGDKVSYKEGDIVSYLYTLIRERRHE